MRELRIILPLADNDGNPTDRAHASLADALLRMFGGYTATDVTGAWMDAAGKVYHDKSRAYDVATDAPDADDHASVIAIRAGKLAKQEAVYFRATDGTVDIFPCN